MKSGCRIDQRREIDWLTSKKMNCLRRKRDVVGHGPLRDRVAVQWYRHARNGSGL